MSPKSECFIEIADTTFSRAMYIEAKSGDIVYDRVEEDFAGLDVKFEALGNTISVFGENHADSYVEFNAPISGDPSTTPSVPGTEETLPESSETTVPAEDTAADGETTAEEEITEPEDIGDIDEEENNTSVTIPANSLTIIIEDGKIEVK